MRSKSPRAVWTILLVLLDVAAIVGWVVTAAIAWLGLATTFENTISPDRTAERSLIEGVAGAPWFPGALLVLIVGLTIFLCGNFLKALKFQSGNEASADLPSIGRAPFNRLATYFSGQQIRVADFIPQGAPPIIKSKILEDCVVYGPAVLNKARSPLQDCTYSDATIYIEVQADVPLVGMVRVEDCTFTRCHFVNVGLAALKHEMVTSLPASLTVQPTGASPTMLRPAAFQLAKDIRDMAAAVADGLSNDEQCDLLFEDFNKRLWDRFAHIKQRLSFVLPPRDTMSAHHTLPTTKANLELIAEVLEREALRVPSDVLL